MSTPLSPDARTIERLAAAAAQASARLAPACSDWPAERSGAVVDRVAPGRFRAVVQRDPIEACAAPANVIATRSLHYCTTIRMPHSPAAPDRRARTQGAHERSLSALRSDRFLALLGEVEEAETVADLRRLRAVLLERLNVVSPDDQTRHVLTRLDTRERDLMAIESLIASV
jgi:hypothetical protein